MSDRALASLEFRRHWKLVVAAAIGFSFSSVISGATGLFMEPLGKEFGWSRALQASGLSIAAVTGVICSPFVGALVDRLGTRRLALSGLGIMSLAIAGFSLANGSPAQWILMWTIYALAGLATQSMIWTAAVSSVFNGGRGLAIGLTLSGSAAAQAITPPLTNYLIQSQGWRSAFVWLGFGWGGIALLCCSIWFFDGYGSRAKMPNEPQESRPRGPRLDVPGLSVSQAWRSAALWRIGISTFIVMGITVALNIHQFQILVETGLDRTRAAFYCSVAGGAGIIGKLVTGWLLDRFPARWVGSTTLLITTITFIVLMIPHQSAGAIVIAMFINGYAAGTKLQIAGYLTSIYGGMRNYGAIFGFVASLIAASSGIGPVVCGLIYDIYGNYNPFLIFGLLGTVFSAFLIFGLPDYPDWVDYAAPSTKAQETPSGRQVIIGE